MNLKVAGIGGVAVVAFVASIYWLGNLGPAIDPTNAMAGFYLFQSHCSIPPIEPGERVAPPVSGAKATARAIDARPRNATKGQVVVVPCHDPKAATVVVIVNQSPLIVHLVPSDASSTR